MPSNEDNFTTSFLASMNIENIEQRVFIKEYYMIPFLQILKQTRPFFGGGGQGISFVMGGDLQGQKEAAKLLAMFSLLTSLLHTRLCFIYANK